MRPVHWLCFSLIFCLSQTVSSADPNDPAASFKYPRVPQAFILSISGKHYPAITRALSSVGFRVREISAADYLSSQQSADRLLIVPESEGQRLDMPLFHTILLDVQGGMPLLTDGATPLASEFGIKATTVRGEITKYRWDHYADVPLRLPARLAYTRFKDNPALQVLALDPKTRAPLVVAGSHGQGQFIHSTIPLEPESGKVFQYLPFLAQAIVDELHVAPTLAADNLCVYVDAGGDPSFDAVAMVARLKSWSVREVHLGAFYESEMFQDFARRFIAAAHREGITVYAWLEYPMVSEEFWKRYPKWREITGNLQPAIMDWRYHMALEDPDCLRAVLDQTRRLVLDYDWDGVDFAELYFEAAPGIFKDPEDFTPMHPTFRKMFQERYGVDPLELFNPESSHYGLQNPKLRSALRDYRIELITKLTETFLDTLAGCQAQKPYLRTTLTFVDALSDPSVKERFGVDPDRLLALEKKYGFDVEVEDPYTVWNSGADRYRLIGEYYRARVQAGTPLSIDINVAERIPPGRPLDKPRGQELYDLVATVAAHVDLLTLYGFSTLSPDDMRLVPFVLGASQLISEPAQDGTIQARRQIYWHIDTRGQSPYLDGHEWPCWSDSAVLIPAGTHQVSLRPEAGSAESNPLRVESINGALLSAERAGPRVTLTYEARGQCYVTLNHPPTTVLCDGASGLAKVLTDGDHVCVVLPQGKHTLEIE